MAITTVVLPYNCDITISGGTDVLSGNESYSDGQTTASEAMDDCDVRHDVPRTEDTPNGPMFATVLVQGPRESPLVRYSACTRTERGRPFRYFACTRIEGGPMFATVLVHGPKPAPWWLQCLYTD